MLAFPRGNGPLVSVLICTRGRPAWLVQSIQSLLNKCVDRTQIEFVFRCDADDEESVNNCRHLLAVYPNSQLLVSPRGKGYLDIHNWTYTLAILAKGDWVMIWNDDTLMATEKWDEILNCSTVQCWHNVPDVCMLVMQSKGRPGCNEFMFIRRKTLQILGSLGQSPHADNWMTRVMTAIQSIGIIPIEVEHYSGQMTDKTREESVAAYADGATARETLESDWAQVAIRKDTQKLLAYILSNDTSRRL